MQLDLISWSDIVASHTRSWDSDVLASISYYLMWLPHMLTSFDLSQNLLAELNLGGHRKKKRRKGGPSMGVGAQRRTRAGLLETKGPKTFMALLEEAELDLLPRDEPSYASAAVQASKVASSRPWCTVCGFQAPYTCTRCSSRFCSRKCYALHSETRCLKFTT